MNIQKIKTKINQSQNSQEEQDYLTDYSPNDKKWDDHKSGTEKIKEYYSASSKDNHSKYADRMSDCASLLRFNFIDNPDGESELKLNRASFCRVRLCPVCQWRRSMAWRGKLFNKLPDLLNENSDLEFLFLTLTVKNCHITKLSDQLNEMNKAWKKLIDLKVFGTRIQGFIRATEVTRSEKDGSAHPHFHCILAVKKSYFQKKYYINTNQWADLWRQCLRVDYLPVCDVRKIKKTENKVDHVAICEILKYTTKIKDLITDKNWFLELSDQLFKKRFLSTGGILKNLLKEEVNEQEMINTEIDEKNDDESEEELAKKSLYFGWKTDQKKYKKVKNPHLE